jgi:hypothetical protein
MASWLRYLGLRTGTRALEDGETDSQTGKQTIRQLENRSQMGYCRASGAPPTVAGQGTEGPSLDPFAPRRRPSPQAWARPHGIVAH